MATTNPSVKISALAKELKMKSGKELQEKLKELGFEYKTTSASIEPQAFNKLFASISESYTEKSISLEDYLEGKAVITEFSGSAAPDTDKKPGKATETKTTEQKSKEKKKTETPDTPAPEKASETTVSKPKSKPAEIKNQSTVSGSTEVKKDVQEKSKAAVGTEPDSKPETKQESKNEPAKEKSAEKQTESKKSSAEVKTAGIKKPESAQSRAESGSQTAGKPEENKTVAKTEKTEPKPLDNKKVSGEVKVPETKKNEPAVKSPDTVKASEPAKATETAKSYESEKTAAATKPVETKKPQQKERTFTPPPQHSKPQKVQQKPQRPQPNLNQQRPKSSGGVELNAQPERTGTNPKARVVDTRGSNVNLSKYDEKLENLASKAGKDFGDSRGGRIIEGRKKVGKFDREKDKEKIELEKLRKQQMEKARRLPVSVSIPDEITVGELAIKLKITVADLIKKLFSLGVMATVNQTIDFDTAYLIADEMGAKVTKEVVVTIEDKLFEDEKDDPKSLVTRAPVVCVMGHVDHGKTSLLDAIRHTKVTAGEAGGITQHIGAYRVKVDGRDITFLDTPGHEAFTLMRARGAMATDIAILVVAADDGIMPQTVEAINHAKAAGVDIIVAINKMDKPTANPDQIKQALTQYELVPEEWGGDVICVPVSAVTGQGIQDLLENIILIADVKEYKANPDRKAKGVVIEAKLDKGRGPVATVLVQNGTLKVGDTVIAGTAVGRVKAMKDDNGKHIKSAGPSVPVEIDGLSEVPGAGDEFNVVENERMAKELAEQRKAKQKDEMFRSNAKVNLEALFDSMGDGVKELNVIVKADVQGSAEAVKTALLKLSNDEVKVNVIHSGAGGIVESDVMLASASNAIIVGFNVRPDKVALDSAEKQKVDIRTYRIIYDCIEEISAAMKGMLEPTYKESVIGHAEVRQAIKVPNVGIIAGCYITDGKATRNCKMRILRDSVVLCEDKLASLRRFKDDVKEVAQGFECGIGIEHFNDIREGDILEFFEMVEVKK